MIPPSPGLILCRSRPVPHRRFVHAGRHGLEYSCRPCFVGIVDVVHDQSADARQMFRVRRFQCREPLPSQARDVPAAVGLTSALEDQLTCLQDASAAVKAEAQAGKCWDGVEKDFKLPKYQS